MHGREDRPLDADLRELHRRARRRAPEQGPRPATLHRLSRNDLVASRRRRRARRRASPDVTSTRPSRRMPIFTGDALGDVLGRRAARRSRPRHRRRSPLPGPRARRRGATISSSDVREEPGPQLAGRVRHPTPSGEQLAVRGIERRRDEVDLAGKALVGVGRDLETRAAVPRAAPPRSRSGTVKMSFSVATASIWTRPAFSLLTRSSRARPGGGRARRRTGRGSPSDRARPSRGRRGRAPRPAPRPCGRARPRENAFSPASVAARSCDCSASVSCASASARRARCSSSRRRKSTVPAFTCWPSSNSTVSMTPARLRPEHDGLVGLELPDEVELVTQRAGRDRHNFDDGRRRPLHAAPAFGAVARRQADDPSEREHTCEAPHARWPTATFGRASYEHPFYVTGRGPSVDHREHTRRKGRKRHDHATRGPCGVHVRRSMNMRRAPSCRSHAW